MGDAPLPYYQEWFLAQGLLAGIRQSVPDAAHRPGMGGHASVRVAVETTASCRLRSRTAKLLPDRPDLIDKLTPDFRPYAKRIVKDPGFFAALNREHVPCTGPRSHVSTPRCHHHGGEFIEADVIIFATGFKLQFASYIDITGRGGHKLADVWDGGDDPRATWVSRCRGSESVRHGRPQQCTESWCRAQHPQ